MFYYKIYGFIIASELEIPDAESVALGQTARTPDVTISLAPVSQDFFHDEEYVQITDAWGYYVKNPRHFYMRCCGYDFEITNGNSIIVDTHDQDAGNPDLSAFILGSAFGVIGMQRGLIPIHGAAVVTGDASVIITGGVGTGKSAVLSSLIMDGYQYLADDICMVFTDEGRPFVIPSYPQRKIDTKTAEETRVSVSGTTLLDESGKDKFAVRRAAEWLDEALPLSCIVEIDPVTRKDGAAFSPEVTKITGHASLRLVMRNQYRPRFVASIGTPPGSMKRLLEITSSIKTYRLLRPVEGFPINETARIIAESCF